MSAILFNPFERIAGGRALIWGLAVMLITSVFASLANLQFDGVLDMHFVEQQSSISFFTSCNFCYVFFQLIYCWIVSSFLFYFSGLIASKSQFRILDIFGTQAFARIPFILPAIIALATNQSEVSSKTTKQVIEGTSFLLTPAELLLFGLFLFFSIISIIWSIALMYNAYRVSANVKGLSATIYFIISIILAEIITKISFYLLTV